MQEIIVRYMNGPMQGQGSVSVPDQETEPPLRQRIPLPGDEHGMRRTLTDAFGSGTHAIYERAALNASDEWEYQLVRIE